MNATKSQPKVKPVRSAQLSTMTHGKLLLGIYEAGRLINAYIVTPLASQIGGTAYRLGKATPDGCSEDYDVLLNGRETSCTCPGHTYKGHCKHVEALEALAAAGKLLTSMPKSTDEPKEEKKSTVASPAIDPAPLLAMRPCSVERLNGHRVVRAAAGWWIGRQLARTAQEAAEMIAQF